MKNSEVLQLNSKINFYSKELRNLKGAKFSYGLIKNIGILQKECKDIMSILNASDEYKAYDTKRIALCQKFAKKDEKNEVIKKNLKEDGSYDFDIDPTDPNWIEAINSLKEENKALIDEQDKKIEEYNKFLDKDSIIEFFKMDLEDVSDEVSVELMSIIEKFLK